MAECFAACQEDPDIQMKMNYEMMKKGRYQRRDTLFAINTEVGGKQKHQSSDILPVINLHSK